MTTSTVGLLAGLLLAIAIAAGGFTGLLTAVNLGAAGYLIGAHRDGEIDLAAIVKGRGRG
jgi:uncharacterized membrane protein